MNEDLHGLHRAVGELTGAVKALHGRMDDLIDHAKERIGKVEDRVDTHDKALSNLKTHATKVSTVAAMAAFLAPMIPSFLRNMFGHG